MKFATVLIALMLGSLLVPLVSSHAAPEPRDFETRLIHDANDDSAVVLATTHGFDSIALDVRSGRTPMGDPAMIFRMLLNEGCKAAPSSPEPIPEDPPNPYPAECPELKQVVEFSLNGTMRQAEFVSNDGGMNFTGNLAHYVGPMGINDGTRFAIEGYYRINESMIGATISDFFVYGYQGGEAADNMPEFIGAVPDPRETAYLLESTTIGDPDGYLELGYDLSVLEASGAMELSLTSLVSENQMVNFTALGDVEVIDGDDVVGGVELSAGFTKNLRVRSTSEHAGPAQVIFVTDLGGYAFVNLQVMGEHHEQGSTITSPDVPVGTSWSYTFEKVGSFGYHNHHAPDKEGVIRVHGVGNGTTHTVTFTDQFSPSELEIGVGDTVEFVNDGDDLMMIMGAYGGMDHSGHDAHGEEGHDHDSEVQDGKDSPGLGLVVLLAALAAIVLVRRK